MLVILKPTQVMFHKPKRSSYGTLVVQKRVSGGLPLIQSEPLTQNAPLSLRLNHQVQPSGHDTKNHGNSGV